MNFSQYMSGGGGSAPEGTISDLGLVCFEDGTCVPGSGRTIGVRQDPSGVRNIPNQHRTYGDGTGGHFLFGKERHVAPQGTPREANPRTDRALALLLELMRRADRGPERREGTSR